MPKIIEVFAQRAAIYTADEESFSDLFHDNFWLRRIVNEARNIIIIIRINLWND